MIPEINKLRTLADNMGAKLLPAMEKKELTKDKVYVVVDTPKKAKKLKEVLDMFVEDIYIGTNERLSKKEVSEEYPNVHLLFNDEWVGDCRKDGILDKTKVSIKQLKQILAKEHLKEGDWIIARCSHPSCDYLVKVDRIEDNMIKGYYSFVSNFNNKWAELSDSIGGFEKFKRYATPEEIDLLEPKPKELEAGKWYKVSGLQSGCFGFSGFGQIVLNEKCNHGLCEDEVKSKAVLIRNVNGVVWRINSDAKFSEATPQEVEYALIEEAKRRGFKEGVSFKSLIYDNDESKLSSNKLDWEECINGEWHLRDSIGESIFHNGKWATIIEQDKFAELKEAHKNGAVIELWSYIFDKWIPAKIDSDLWLPNREYRIKPEEKPIFKILFNIVKGNKCIRQFPIEQANSLVHCGWREVNKVEACELLFNE